MKSKWSKQVAVMAAMALLVAGAAAVRAQSLGSASGMAASLTGSQQSLANKALCSALSSQVPNPAAASPSDLSSPGVMSTAATSFAGSTKLPLASASGLLEKYVASHATSILASCAVSNATGGLTSKVPGVNLPSAPKMPGY